VIGVNDEYLAIDIRALEESKDIDQCRSHKVFLLNIFVGDGLSSPDSAMCVVLELSNFRVIRPHDFIPFGVV
jgi:hypothetical protein